LFEGVTFIAASCSDVAEASPTGATYGDQVEQSR